MVPNPIFSAWRNPASQSVSGCIKWNLSHPHKSSCSCAVARQLLPCSIGAWMTISAHALSSATGSAEARMPRSGTMAASLWFQQSHSGDTFMMKLMWKWGLPITTARAYSAIL